MKIFLIVIAALIGVVAVVVLIGSLLPSAHSVSASTELAAAPDTVWHTIVDYARFPEWRSGLRAVKPFPPAANKNGWIEIDKHGQELPLEIVSATTNELLVLKIADPSLPFGGTWTYRLKSSGSATALEITEDGEVYNPIFRFISRVFMNQAETIETYLADLQKRLAGA